MNIVKPPKLYPGDSIGIVSSSLPLLPSFRNSYNKGKEHLQKIGFKIIEGDTLGKIRWWSGGTPKEQAEDINKMFANKKVNAIMSLTGGYSAISVLEHLDYDLIRNNPKPFIGMSDITVFHTALFSKSNLVGFHMDDVTFGIGWNWQQSNSKDKEYISTIYTKILTSTKTLEPYKHITSWETWKGGSAEGILLGGNLHLFTSLYGTPYFPSLKLFEGALLYWEDEGVSLYHIARALYQLKYWGILDKISGMIIGKITNVKKLTQKEITEPTYKELILDILSQYSFPVLSEVDFGHYTINLPMPFGIRAKMDSTKQILQLLESPIKD
jgi:muramoyltetrapeptide carboxypeptidase